jgi:hypothetical protein
MQQEKKLALGMIAAVLAGITAFLLCSVGIFFAAVFLDNSHDGLAGMSYLLYAPIGGALFGIGVGAVLGRLLWLRYSKSSPEAVRNSGLWTKRVNDSVE